VDPGPVFVALADPTRRSLFDEIVHDGPLTATELAARRDISRQAVAKHLVLLGEAGLVVGERCGREVRYDADPAPLQGAMEWMSTTSAAWDRRLSRLATLVDRRSQRR
jgi:DNA-binding transcriptional ArsR family regulator